MKSDNDLPFSDELYDHLKYTIEKISARMKSPKILSVEEVKKLELSIHAIIKDATGSTPVEAVEATKEIAPKKQRPQGDGEGVTKTGR